MDVIIRKQEYHVEDALYKALKKQSKMRTGSYDRIVRAKVFVYTLDGMTQANIALRTDMHVNSVAMWQKRCLEELPRLNGISTSAPENLAKELRIFLSDNKRPGCPKNFTEEQCAAIVAIERQPPESFGFTVPKWSLSILRLAVVQEGIVPKISKSQLGKILKTVDPLYYRGRYWLFSKDKAERPEVFHTKISEVCRLYHVSNIYSQFMADSGMSCLDPYESHFHVLSVDEMTAIQALERVIVRTGAMTLEEFEYVRHGVTSLIAFLDISTGMILSPYLNSTRTDEDFLCAVSRLINGFTDDTWTLIADNLNVHKSCDIVMYIVETCGVEECLRGLKGIPGFYDFEVPVFDRSAIDPLATFECYDALGNYYEMAVLDDVTAGIEMERVLSLEALADLAEYNDYDDLLVLDGFTADPVLPSCTRPGSTPQSLDSQDDFIDMLALDELDECQLYTKLETENWYDYDALLFSDGKRRRKYKPSLMDHTVDDLINIPVAPVLEFPTSPFSEQRVILNTYGTAGETDDQLSWMETVHNARLAWETLSATMEIALGKEGTWGILKSMASREAFISCPDHHIRIAFTPKHCSWANQIEIWFGVINRKLIRHNSFDSVAYLEQKILDFIRMYNELFAHPYNWTYDPNKRIAA